MRSRPMKPLKPNGLRWGILLILIAVDTSTSQAAAPHPRPVDRYDCPLPYGAIRRFGTDLYRDSIRVYDIAFCDGGGAIASQTCWGRHPFRTWRTSTGREWHTFRHR